MISEISEIIPTGCRTAFPHASTDLAAGRPVVLCSDGSLDGYLMFAAANATAATMAFAVRHTSGFLSVALPAADCDRLELPPMCPRHRADHSLGGPVPVFTVSVDARNGITTGISAPDRCHTARLLADPSARPADFVRPGHVMVVAAAGTGTLTDIATDLVAAAGSGRAAVLGAIVGIDDPTRMADRAELTEFARAHGLALVTGGGAARPGLPLLAATSATTG